MIIIQNQMFHLMQTEDHVLLLWGCQSRCRWTARSNTSQKLLEQNQGAKPVIYTCKCRLMCILAPDKHLGSGKQLRL